MSLWLLMLYWPIFRALNPVAAVAWSPLAIAERSQYLRLWQPDEPGVLRIADLHAIRTRPFIDYTRQVLRRVRQLLKADALIGRPFLSDK